MDGKLGLRYSKYRDSYCEEFDNLTFEEWEPDLSSNLLLIDNEYAIWQSRKCSSII